LDLWPFIFLHLVFGANDTYILLLSGTKNIKTQSAPPVRSLNLATGIAAAERGMHFLGRLAGAYLPGRHGT